MKNTCLGLLAVAALSACGATMPIETPPVNVTITNPAANQDIIKIATPAIRTQRFDEAGQKTEVAGASCDLKGQGFNAKFLTPAIVRIPMKKGRPPNIVVTCTDGTNTRTQSIAATNLTNQRIQNSGVGAGLIGVLVASAIAANRDTTNDEFEFTGGTVLLNDRP